MGTMRWISLGGKIAYTVDGLKIISEILKSLSLVFSATIGSLNTERKLVVVEIIP